MMQDKEQKTGLANLVFDKILQLKPKNIEEANTPTNSKMSQIFSAMMRSDKVKARILKKKDAVLS